MESTDRMQVRDLIEKLKEFDPCARITGADFEIEGVRKGDDCLVYIDVDKDSEVIRLEDECERLESELEIVKSENRKLRGEED